MFKPFRFFPNTIGKAFIVLTVTVVLLTGWGQPAGGQPESSSKADSPGVTSKTIKDTPEVYPEEPQHTPQSPAEKTPVGPSGEAGKWLQRYEKLVEGINEESLGYEDADTFYQELNVALRDSLADLTLDQPQLSRVSPEKIEQLQSDLTVLYDLRIQILEFVSPGLRGTVTGTGVDGVQAFKGEIDYLLLTFRIRLHLLPQVGLRAADDMLSAPTPVILIVVKLAVAFLVFFWWRRWAVQGIPRVRNNILDIKPRKSIHKWLAKLLWYLNRVRRPLEWGLLLWVLFSIISTTEGQLIYNFLWTKAKWILTVWFAVALIGAASTRGTLRLKSNTANLRLRSIRIIASWVLVAGLGLSITEDLVGKGTIYAWVWIFSKFLALPMLFLLIRWWREEIYRELEEVSQQPAYIQKILQHKQGLGSFLGTVFGAIYLIMNAFRQRVLRGVSAFEGGRYFIANLTQLEAIRVSERTPQKIQGDPILDEMRHLLYADDGGLVESVGHDSLERMIHLADQGRKGGAVIIAEQGGGKTHLFKRLGSRFEGKMILFECPPGGIDAFQRNFAESLGLNASDLTTEAISERLQENQISVIGVDNLHRLSRPAFGGQRDMDQVAGLIIPLQADVFWFFGVNWAAWHYISRVRASQLFLDDILRMPLWTEEQIRELIELRSAHAGIEPDFGELILPRQFEGIDYDTVEDRNRFGFYRILWNASDGNPMVSLQLWADSLRIAPDGRILVSLPQLPATSELEKANMTLLLILRVIAQSEMASREEIIDSLRFPATEVAGALHLAITNEWVELVNGRYRLTWKWFRSIMRMLARKNLLVRKIMGG